MSTSSKGQRSAADVRESHQTTGDPVWTATDSAQLKAMSMLCNPDFIIQNDMFVSAGFPDHARISSKFSILDEVTSVEQMRAVFWGASPNLLLVYAADQLDDLLDYMRKIVKLLTTVAQLDVILYAKSSAVDSSSFLNNAMSLKDQLPFLPDRIGQVDRLLGSISRSETYDAWVIRTSHQSRFESASVIYKMINLRQPGESADGVSFREPDIKYQVLVLQYAVSWEDQLLASISKSREEVDIVPGSDAQASKFMFVELDYGQASRLVEEFGRYPRFAILPLPWYTGSAVQKSAHRLEVSMSAAFREKHLKFFFSYVLAAFWELGELFSGKDVAVHIVHSKRIRVGLSKKAYEHACAKKEEWYTEMGLELLDEQTGQKLSGSIGTSTQASSVPEAWGPCESIYLTNVPPYWRSDVLQEVLMTQGTGQKDFVLDKCRFHLGDIRTKT